jgi:hypothetical protein
MPITCPVQNQMSKKAIGVLPLDIFLCMLYNKDDNAIRKTIRPFLIELGKEFDCSDLLYLVDCLPLVGLRAMFFMLIVIDHKIRHWAMLYEDNVVVKPPPHKVCIFVKTLRDDTIHKWMSNEKRTCVDFFDEVKKLYLRC